MSEKLLIPAIKIDQNDSVAEVIKKANNDCDFNRIEKNTLGWSTDTTEYIKEQFAAKAIKQKNDTEKEVIKGDILSAYSPLEVSNWYRRLAQDIKKQFSSSLSADLLLHWLNGKGGKKIVSSSHIKDVHYVKTYLRNEVRPVFLTEKKAKIKPSPIWGGVKPRIKKFHPYKKNENRSFQIMYEGPPVEIPLAIQAKALMGTKVDEELDLLYALHTFALITNVFVKTEPVEFGSRKYNVTFLEWKTKMRDTYDWDPTKHIKVPNPDYGSKEKFAISPKDEMITVFHRNARRVEMAGLAAPFQVESDEWGVTDSSISGPAVVVIE